MRRIFLFIIFSLFIISGRSMGQSIQWTQKQSLPKAYRNGNAVSCNGKIYFMGGYCDSTPERFEKTNYEYDPAANKWTLKKDIATGRSNFAMAANDNKIYVIGGDPFSPRNDVYNPETDTWNTLHPMLTPRQHISCAVVNNKIYIAGGLMNVEGSSSPDQWSYKNITDKNEVYDPAADSWEEKAPMPTRRHGAFMAAVNGKVYVIGGMGDETDIWKSLAVVEMYDPETDKWETKANLPEPRDGFGITVTDNKIYVIGGFYSQGIANTVYVYNPMEDKWTTSTEFPNVQNGSPGCASIENKIYLIGGCDKDYKSNGNLFEGTVSNNNVIFDYLGETPPGDTPVVFARGIISTDELEHGAPMFSPDGNEVYWFKNHRPKAGENWSHWMETMHRVGDKWTAPEVAKYGGQPFFSYDGKKLYFDILPSDPDQKGDAPYFVEKQNDSWGEIKSIKLASHFPEIQFVSQISLSKNGNLYFLGHAEGTLRNFGIYKSEFLNGEYTKPELLPECINTKGALNWTPFISPDESYLLFASSRHDSTGRECDLYISFRHTDGGWSKAYSLGKPINSNQMDRLPAVSLDGKYLFFTRWTPDHDFDVFWVSAKIIYELKILYAPKDYYMGQTPPRDEPVIFAPGLVSTENKNRHALVNSPDGNIIIFSRYPDRTSYILTKENDKWGRPVESFFYGKEVSFSPDGNKIFHYTDSDTFYVERISTGWSPPVKLGPEINTTDLAEFYPSIVSAGDMYFSRDGNWATGRIMYSKFQNGNFQIPTDLGSPVNNGGAIHAWVSPDDTYILFNSPRAGRYTQNDIWISFKGSDGKWTEPQNPGKKINSSADAILCPTVSPDGKYMFFTTLNFNPASGNIYWVSTSFIDNLKINIPI